MKLQDTMLAVLRHAGRSPSTQVSYCREIRRFLKWLRHDRPLRVRRTDVVGYLEELGEHSLSNRRMAHAGLRFFYIHVVNRPEVVEGIPWPRKSRSLRQVPVWTDVETLLEAIEHPVCRMAATVIAATGLRVSEVCALRVSDIQTERAKDGGKLDYGVLVVSNGKGAKGRFAPLAPTLTHRLRSYFRQVRPEGFLFPNDGRTNSITPKLLRKHLQRAVQRSDISNISPHLIRHAFATRMLERGADLPTLQAALGHQRASTTSLYLHVRRDKLAAMPDLLA